MAIVNLSAPWVEHYYELCAFFRNDSEVAVVFDPDKMIVKLYVDDMRKAEALEHVIAHKLEFGNVTLNVEVVPGNDAKKFSEGSTQRDIIDDMEIWQIIGRNNPAIDRIIKQIGIGGMKYTFVMCDPVVVQYFNDNTADLNGLTSTLYENIARDIFTGKAGVFFCTSPHVGKTENRGSVDFLSVF